MTHEQLPIFFLALGTLLLVARILGEIARHFDQPSVLGEILAGVILGPTILGRLAPDFQHQLFPGTGSLGIAMSGFTNIAISLFLLVAGLEVDLSSILRQVRSSFLISSMGMAIPFAVGFGCAWFLPHWLGSTDFDDRLLPFALFMGTALSISALPVIAKTLLDLNIYRTDFGMLVIAAAVIDDIAGWLLFSIVLGMIGDPSRAHFTVGTTIVLTIGFAAFCLTIGRWLLDRILPLVQAYTTWPGGVLSFAVAGGMFSAAFTEYIGVHGIFGAFIFGVALGDSSHLREKTRHTLENFISFIFAPIFFASIGLKVDFIAHFDLGLVLFTILIACVGKILGCGLAGRMSGLAKGESMALAMAMNARGAMGIILALIALDAGLIREKTFVALVVMALVTSMAAGGLIERLLERGKVTRFFSFLQAHGFIASLKSTDSQNAIVELSLVAARGTDLVPTRVAEEAWMREQLISTGMGHGVAIPHARIAGLKSPLVAVGISERGIDFDAPDGEPAKLVLLILTPKDSNALQLEMLADIGRTFSDEAVRTSVFKARNYVEFIAALKSA